jgi:hypothetical protein
MTDSEHNNPPSRKKRGDGLPDLERVLQASIKLMRQSRRQLISGRRNGEGQSRAEPITPAPRGPAARG